MMILVPTPLMTNPVSIRSYAPSDLETLAALRLGRSPSAGDAVALARWLGQPNIDPERDCMLAFDAAGAPAGYAILTREPAIRRGVLEIQGSGAHRGGGAGDALLREAAERALAAGLDRLHVDVPEEDEARRDAFAARGWTQVRAHLHLRRPPSPPAPAILPLGTTLRHAETTADAEAVAALQNAAFAGSWGYAPNTPEEIAYRIFEIPDVPDHVAMIEDAGSKELIAYAWGHRPTADRPAVIGMVGVAPDRQGQGLGRIVTGFSVNALADSGAGSIEITVDSENPAAIWVYESLGFALDHLSFWQELRLTGVDE